MFLCTDACNTTIYIQNRCLHMILEDNTLEETFSNVKPEVSHFHIFGCPIHIHAPVENMTKLEPSSMKGIYVGYSDTSKVYMVYIPEKRKTIVSRDVKFEENFASKKSHEPILVTMDEQEAPKVEPGSPVISRAIQPPLGEEGERVAPSTSIRWFTLTLRDDREYVEAPRSTFRDIIHLKKFPKYIAPMSSIIDFETSNFREVVDHKVWRDTMVE
jgi:hypothetical protein